MWSLLSRKTRLSVIVVAALATAWGLEAAYEQFTGKPVWIVKVASLTVFVVGVVLAGLFQLGWRWLWRTFPALGRWVFPDLNGRWSGTLASTWINPETGQGIPPILITVWIRQGLFTTSIRLKTRESQSFSTRAFLEPARERACYRLWYSYNNDPDARFRDRSSPHEGVAFLEFETGLPGQLKGTYYTARKTTGDIALAKVSADADA